MFDSDLQAERNGFLDVLKSLFLAASLAHTTWDGGALHHPDTILVTI